MVRLIPDHIVCARHDPHDWRLYQYANGRVERRCLGCRRERSGYLSRNHTDRCRRGHLKTPWTWRFYGPHGWGRCLTCQYELRRCRSA